MTNILITGGSGFLAESLIKRLHPCHNIRLMSRNEGLLLRYNQGYNGLETYPGDISNPFEVKQACKGIEEVYHLAAFKHVGLAETFSKECIKSNVIGSMNLLEETLNGNIKKIIGISTDKAAKISGVYGSTKFLMEKLFQQYEAFNPYTQYRIVRYGNVLYSTGSVLCKWKQAIEANQQCVITDLSATRFYWTATQAVDLIFQCLDEAKDSTPFCPEMKAIRIEDLYNAMVLKYGKNYNVKPKIIGLQPGENLHEKILANGFSSNESGFYSIDEIVNLI